MIDGPVFGRGIVRKGRLRIDQANVFAAQLQQLRDGVVEIAIARKRATRSQAANRYWWGVCVASRRGRDWRVDDAADVARVQ